MRPSWLSLFTVATMTAPVAAQQVTVQQPAVQTFGVGTSVSVPDRGRMYLGGVSSGRSARSTYGPLRSGTSLGSEYSGSSMSVGVYIHDLRAMDEALLALGGGARPADNAWEQRLTERRASSPASAVASRSDTLAARLANFEALAQRAEERGKPAVALVYWRLAAKEGSTRAAVSSAFRRETSTSITRRALRAASTPRSSRWTTSARAGSPS